MAFIHEFAFPFFRDNFGLVVSSRRFIGFYLQTSNVFFCVTVGNRRGCGFESESSKKIVGMIKELAPPMYYLRETD
ncbi:hypothetical protein L596_002950 [Steinernema carpocapsae]|uniref:Uncharacterized protein n=1 Tax=Steinernema carpocapsae TaxID=34508 RepID=A0A4U8URM4_STECR|nr:hypothetical protein L596_002950 [Steinernema carpocapsae]